MKFFLKFLAFLAVGAPLALSHAQAKVSPFDGYWLSTTRAISGDMIFGVLVRNQEISFYESSVPTELGDPDLAFASINSINGNSANLELSKLEQDLLKARGARLASAKVEMVDSTGRPNLLVHFEFEDLESKKRTIEQRIYRKSDKAQINDLISQASKFRKEFFETLWTLDTTILVKDGKRRFFFGDEDRSNPFIRIKNLYFHDDISVEINQSTNSLLGNNSFESRFEFSEKNGLSIYLPDISGEITINFGDIEFRGDAMITRIKLKDGTLIERLFLKRGQTI